MVSWEQGAIVTLWGLVGQRGSCGTMELWQLWPHGTEETVVTLQDPMELRIHVIVWDTWKKGTVLTLWGFMEPRRAL